jgi:hypothetical protein
VEVAGNNGSVQIMRSTVFEKLLNNHFTPQKP